MDINHPYYPSHYAENSDIGDRRKRFNSVASHNTSSSSSSKTHHATTLQIQHQDNNNSRASILLMTEPKDLDKLFDRTSLLAEQDICFPNSNKRSSSTSIDGIMSGGSGDKSALTMPESNTIDMDSRQHQQHQGQQRHNYRHNRHNSSLAGIDLDALATLDKTQYSSSSNINRSSTSPIHSPLPDKVPYVADQQQKLSLYGDNQNQIIYNRACADQSFMSQQEDRYNYYHPETGCLSGKSLTELQNISHGLSLEQLLLKENYWIDITSPSIEEMHAISKIFLIHPLTTEDIISHEIREKCDVFRHYIFVCYRAFLHDHHRQLVPVTFYTIVTKNHILTFHFGQVPHIQQVQKRVIQLQDYIEVVPDWINYAVMDEITDSFAPIIQQIESEVDAIDDMVLLYNKTDQTDMILRIGTCRKRVIQMVRLLGTKAEVVRGLMKRIIEERNSTSQPDYDAITKEDDNNTLVTTGKIYPDVGLYLGDVQDHILTMLQNLNHYETVLARSESNYLARISIELTQTSNSTNHVIGRLTVFATVLLPMNLVTGLWGMNVKVPGKDYDNLLYFFWIVISLIIFAILSLILAKRLGGKLMDRVNFIQ